MTFSRVGHQLCKKNLCSSSKQVMIQSCKVCFNKPLHGI